MHFHDQLFTNKGWKTDGKITSIRLISVLRSDYIHKPIFKKSFLENLVLCMDKLGFKIPKTQIVLDEVGCRSVVLEHDPALCDIVEKMILTNNTPLVFFGEDSPLSALSIKHFVERFTKKRNITEYVLCLYSPITLNMSIEVYMDGKVTMYDFKNKLNLLKVK